MPGRANLGMKVPREVTAQGEEDLGVKAEVGNVGSTCFTDGSRPVLPAGPRSATQGRGTH